MNWRMVATLAACGVLIGCVGQSADHARTTAPAQSGGTMTTAPLPDCGPVPVSSGPASQIVELRLTAPATTAPGAQVPVTATLQITADGQRIITGASMSQLLITHGGKVVGRSDAAQADLSVPLMLRAGATRPAQVLPTSVRMNSCDSATPLPAGEYAIVAVLGYRLDPFNSGVDGMHPGGPFYLVSQPAPITVR
jgi:hypothetical protein